MIILPKPIIRKIIFETDVVTFSIDPTMMLYLLTIGLKDMEYKQLIWRQYYDIIIIGRTSLSRLDNDSYNEIIGDMVKKFGKLHGINTDNYNHTKYPDGIKNKLDSYTYFIHKRWSYSILEDIINGEKVYLIHSVGYCKFFVHMRCLCDFDENYKNKFKDGRCKIYGSKFMNGKCMNRVKTNHVTEIHDLINGTLIENKNLMNFLSYIDSLMKPKKPQKTIDFFSKINAN
jgi:hypothetical protein